jgi:phage protein D
MVAVAPIFRTRDGEIEPFYAPTFRVEVGTSPGDLQPMFDVWRVSYKDTINQIDSFDLTLNNSGWAHDEPLYSARVQPPAGSDPLVMPGSYVRLWMGYRGPIDLYPMLTGRVTSVTPTFNDSGTTLVVRALSDLEALRKAPKKRIWPIGTPGPVKDSEIAQQICSANNVTAVIPRGLTQAEAGEPSVTQANTTDIAFLIQRARRRGYIVCFRENLPPRTASGVVGSRPGGGTPQKFIYFGPSNLFRDQEAVRMGERKELLELGWGKALVELRPTMNLSTTLWSKVTVGFWDRRAKKKTKIDYRLQQLWSDEAGLNEDLEPLISAAGLAEYEVSNVPVHTEGQARDLARNTLRENFLQLVVAEGSTVGHPELRACSRVAVSGVGAPFNGTYFLTSTTHSIDDNGYRVQFSARRENLRQGS